jgi:hypothetical protein
LCTDIEMCGISTSIIGHYCSSGQIIDHCGPGPDPPINDFTSN